MPTEPKTQAALGHVRGKPLRFVKGHSPRVCSIMRFTGSEMSSDLAYVIGFVLADGNIWRNVTAIVQKDPEPLRRILDVLGSTHTVRTRGPALGKDDTRVVHITNKAFTGWLRAYGITENKSLDARLPVVPEPYMGDMIRGYFDGDGSAQYYPRKGFSA